MRTQFITPQLPPAARLPCAKPTALPDRGMTDSEVTRSWGADRAALNVCEQRRAAAVAAVGVGEPK